MAKRSLIIRDAVHGDIALTAEEARAMDTFEMQRLRRIKQLGAADLVYPTAVHTRFDHSLGTLHMAQRLIDSLRGKGAGFTLEQIRCVRLAALLHDVTHVPFGHTFEDERKLFERHDKGGRIDYFLRSPKSELAEVLRELGAADAVYQLLAPGAPASDPPFLKQIVSSTLDADMFDYIRRDLLFTGLRQDYDERLFAYFCVEDGELTLNMEKNGVIRGDALTETLHLLRLRYTLSERVYYHHAKAAAGAMLSKAVECAQGVSEEDLFTLGDDALLRRLESDWATDASRRLVARLRGRKLYKRAYQISYDAAASRGAVAGLIAKYHDQPAARRDAERALAEAVGAEPDLWPVIIYCPESKMAFKEAQVRARLPGGHIMALSEAHEHNPAHAEVAVLQNRYRRLWSLYVFVDSDLLERRERLAAACEEIFGWPNVYRP